MSEANLVFFTARPSVPDWLSRILIRTPLVTDAESKIRALGIPSDWRIAVAGGKVVDVPMGMIGLDSDDTTSLHVAFANRKYENFVLLTKIWPEYDFVFFGDNGEGDALAGLKMLASHGDRVRFVFIKSDLNDAVCMHAKMNEHVTAMCDKLPTLHKQKFVRFVVYQEILARL
jgi:hypothetical protein